MIKHVLILLFWPSMMFASDVIFIEGGSYKTILGLRKEIKVQGFSIDATAVTNSDFRTFLEAHPKWMKTKATALFVDSNYLSQWKSNETLIDASLPQSPVVNVSWFAATAYCVSKNMRLPTVDESEYLAQFGPPGQEKDVKKIILEWYSKPTPTKLPPVKSTFKNKFGVWDVHGLIWEWTSDFSTAFVTGESRGDSALEKSMFCGGGAIGSANPDDYASFMRFGFRSSLKANYSLQNLGFRCAKDGAP